MGASQSRTGDSTPQEVKSSYYELLGLERTATDDDIRRAYKRKALELHPDRNYGREIDTTKLFAEVQAAYEVLSDPHERAWYDSHESDILHAADGSPEVHYEANVRVTTTEDIAKLMKKFNRNVDFSDTPSGFFGFLRDFFEKLVKEEVAAAMMQGVDAPRYPSFGHKDDRHEDVVKTFYAAWANFSTQKTFSWKDKWQPSNASNAPDRALRRHVDKMNQAERDVAIKDFNNAVRNMVAFVRKRDPRYTPVVQSDEERQKILRDAAATQRAKARAENAAKLEANGAVPEWARSQAPEEEAWREENDEEQDEYDCVACGKTFKSEQQFEAHERSKKHQKAVMAIKKKMIRKNKSLNLEDLSISGIMTPMSEGQDDEILHSGQEPNDIAEVTMAAEQVDLDDYETDGAPDNANSDQAEKAITNGMPPGDHEGDDDPSDDEYAPQSQVEGRLTRDKSPTSPMRLNDIDDECSIPSVPKPGKAAQKCAKRAAKAAEADLPENKFKCNVCNAKFPSKSQMFQHIADFGHASLKDQTGSGGGGGKGKGKKKGKK